MAEQWATPIKRDKDFIAGLIFSLKEGYGIWFSYDNITGHQGVHDWITKTSNGREYEYHCEGDHCSESELTDEGIEELANNIASDNTINYYAIQPIPDYKKVRPDPEYDDQALGDYEINGPDRPEPQFEVTQKDIKSRHPQSPSQWDLETWEPK